MTYGVHSKNGVLSFMKEFSNDMEAQKRARSHFSASPAGRLGTVKYRGELQEKENNRFLFMNGRGVYF